MLGVGYSVYEGAVKPAAVKVAHVTKVTGKTVLHLVTFGHR